MSWLGLDSDEPLVYQTTRNSEYKKVIDTLLESGLAYPCFCEPKSVEEKMSEHGHKYSGACRDKAYTKEDLEKPHAIRFRLPEECKEISFDDAIRGTITVDRDTLDDFVIWRRDNPETGQYLFAPKPQRA